MIDIEQVDVGDKRQVRDFMDFPFRLYAGHPLWVPPIRIDVATRMNSNKHPFYEHSDAEFFVAKISDEVVGRIAMLENKPYKMYQAVCVLLVSQDTQM